MLENRSTESEYLDSADCDPELAAESYRFMEKVNRYFGGISNVRRFIKEESKGRSSNSPMRILDIGSGSCDIPIAICRWARSRGIPVKFTCLEVFDTAVKIADEKIKMSGEKSITLLQEDVFTHQPAEPYDCAVASMCFHHFDDDRIVSLMKRLRGFVKRSVLVNDLRRSPLTSFGATQLTAFSHAGVKHDARLSVRRGFKVCELRNIMMRLEGVSVEVRGAWLSRVCALVRFENVKKT
jgi:2-polyprenyl-3-methyl-5-hydroxy-6-metoxy-1,4-benzoquinol methylase